MRRITTFAIIISFLTYPWENTFSASLNPNLKTRTPDAGVENAPLSDKIYLPIESIAKVSFIKVLRVSCDDVSPDFKVLVTQETGKKEIILQDVATNRILWTLSGACPIELSPDGRMLATHVDYKAIILYDVSKVRESGKVTKLHTWQMALEWARLEGSVAFSPDRKLFAAADKNGKIRLYDVTTGKEMYSRDCKWVGSVTFSPDGKLLAIAGKGKAAILIDTTTGKELKALDYPESDPGSYEYLPLDVSFSPDGRVLATVGLRSLKGTDIGSQYQAPLLWDVAAGKVIKRLRNQAKTVVFSPDGRFLITALKGTGNDKPAILYNVATGEELSFGNLRSAGLVKFVSEGKRIVVGNEIWSLEGLAAAEFFKKDEFETTTEHMERVKGIRKPYSTKITLGRYDADRGGFEIDVHGVKALIPMEREKAKQFAAGRDMVYISSELIYAGQDKLELANPQLMLDASIP